MTTFIVYIVPAAKNLFTHILIANSHESRTWTILHVSLVCFNRSFFINPLIKEFIAFRHSIPSPDGQLIATVHKSCVLIRSCVDHGVVQSFESDKCFTGVWRFARWYGQERKNPNKPRESRANDRLSGTVWRFLLADEDFVHAYDANGIQRHVRISNLAGHSGSIADVQFGLTVDQVLVFSDFGLKVILLTISTQRGLELRAPKQITTCYGYRPRTGHLTLLTRPSLHDVLLYLKPDGSGPVVPMELATVDAQGISWSPDGQWLAVWDAATAGYKVLILTADGHLYKTYYGGQNADSLSLGVKTLRWSPSGEVLAIGDFDNRVILLKSNTVRGRSLSESLLALLCHSSSRLQASITRALPASLEFLRGKSGSMLLGTAAMLRCLNRPVLQRRIQIQMTVLVSPSWSLISMGVCLQQRAMLCRQLFGSGTLTAPRLRRC